MASLLGKPLVLVNADAALLLSNKALLPVADRVAFGFDGGDAKKTKRAVVTGNPVRAEIEALPAPETRFAGRSGPLRLLVVGGSLGAQVLNRDGAAALALMPTRRSRPQVTHQTGNAQSPPCAPPTTRPAWPRACCPSSTTWPPSWPTAT
jgi:UDP-N-acetylglucosamine--N-acetylmuramyl-(pentapeptide) pyrophosphoryl-undecaprenol N-acetylglucosamine transferase